MGVAGAQHEPCSQALREVSCRLPGFTTKTPLLSSPQLQASDLRPTRLSVPADTHETAEGEAAEETPFPRFEMTSSSGGLPRAPDPEEAELGPLRPIGAQL